MRITCLVCSPAWQDFAIVVCKWSSVALTDKTFSAPVFRGFLNGLRTELACMRLGWPRNFLPLSAFDVHSPFPLSIFPQVGSKQDRHTHNKIQRQDNTKTDLQRLCPLPNLEWLSSCLKQWAWPSLRSYTGSCQQLSSVVLLRLVVFSARTHDPDFRSESCL